MIAFEVNDMTCGHCVKAISDAVKAADNRAAVHIEPGSADAAVLAGVIREAGYTPVPA